MCVGGGTWDGRSRVATDSPIVTGSEVGTVTIKVGLRFTRTDGRRLREIADRLMAERPEGVDISIFDKAADSAERDEPLQVLASNREEVELMAHGFTFYGVQRPAIDALT